jgi:hypothetical protein
MAASVDDGCVAATELAYAEPLVVN